MYNQISSNIRKTFLLIVLFLIIVIGIGYIISWYYGSTLILYIAVGISLVQAWVGYFHSDSIALAVSRARPVIGKEGRWASQLLNQVENLSITDGIPMPKVYVIEDTAINAFATGRDPKHASIAVTRGAIERLEDEELQGVLAHELSHVKNYDIRVTILVVVLVGIIALISDLYLR
jgi:heat shock protein HtpX